ncbi:hypothetical protein [Nonomuraea sp. bgisy101]|uniref:hypothetical protein n=1 Tax=Nonomuraea sp. bgisy101 TaxID=3413784 RepID=UPI003D753CDF
MGRQHQAVPETFTTVQAAYATALERAPLDGDTRRAYDSRVRTFLAWLDASGLDGDPLTDSHDRDFAVRDYKTHMKSVLGRASNTVNAHLTALDHFFAQLGLGPAVVRRDDAPKLAPRALDARQQKRYLRAVERRPLARDRAIGRPGSPVAPTSRSAHDRLCRAEVRGRRCADERACAGRTGIGSNGRAEGARARSLSWPPAP